MEMEDEALEIWDVRAKEEERGFLGNTKTKTKKNVRLFFFTFGGNRLKLVGKEK